MRLIPFRASCTASVAALMLAGCAGNQHLPPLNASERTCFVAEPTHGQQVGIRFTNQCEVCIAVAFDHEEAGSATRDREGCYVPSGTRVLFKGDSSFRVVEYRDCSETQAEGGLGGIRASALTQNYKTGRCRIIGEFSD